MSNGAKRSDPLWVENLHAEPRARIVVARRSSTVRGRVLEHGSAEYERVWERARELTPQYDRYQAETDRPIPVVALE